MNTIFDRIVLFDFMAKYNCNSGEILYRLEAWKDFNSDRFYFDSTFGVPTRKFNILKP